MIVSASYRTDIPAFYPEWLMARLRAGYCLVANPYGGPDYRVSLDPAEVDGLVLWTRNIGPLLPRLAEIRERGFTFVVQQTVTGYPRALETSVVDAGRAVGHLRELAGRFGPRVPVWRYDPILVSSLTPRQFHVDNFGRLAEALRGATDEVVVSFAQIYRKTERNLAAAAKERGFTWHDPAAEEKRTLVAELATLAKNQGMQLRLCAQPELLAEGVLPAHCIDAERLAALSGRLPRARIKGNRPGCACYESRDIGAYDSCPHGCVYCYAVRSPRLAAASLGRHDPAAEKLLPH